MALTAAQLRPHVVVALSSYRKRSAPWNVSSISCRSSLQRRSGAFCLLRLGCGAIAASRSVGSPHRSTLSLPAPLLPPESPGHLLTARATRQRPTAMRCARRYACHRRDPPPFAPSLSIPPPFTLPPFTPPPPHARSWTSCASSLATTTLSLTRPCRNEARQRAPTSPCGGAASSRRACSPCSAPRRQNAM